MRVGVVKEALAGERRVALVPDTVGKLVAAKLEVAVQAGAGSQAYYADDAYQKAGATVVPDARRVIGDADALLKVQPPTLAEVAAMKNGAILISFLQPSTHADVVKALAKQKVTAFSLELVPRISRAQSMDALSSQAGVSGYKSVILAANHLGKFFPLLITAAGTVTPAKVLVLGAGVAGLQAIATSRRLGAVVEAYDVRPAVKDEVKSLGASFVELPLQAQEGQGGYAAQQSEEFLRRQRELIGDHVAASDVVITTAAVPGRRAPILVTGDMVARMRPGSVIVDLGADSGGNVEVTKPGEVIMVNGVTIDGSRNLASTMPVHASQLFSRNVSTLLLSLVKDGQLQIDFSDEIVKGCCLTNNGELVHPQAKALLEASKA
ncbi:MAG TPA: Re/Si-specific NAD(P)(+) transhydrogenase subunit alpha [Candidatus Dormibacteraeota bacterium]|jgi:NAD(P) transhydrogenase subunit alpha|nr:Re/Si-specific NAD(P)(+) transhydrogenase subunit alpha [Candidatus Dormibacteraeota bacterium]